MNTEVGPKRFGLLHEVAPRAARFGVLINSKNPLTEFAVREAGETAAKIGLQIELLAASADRDIDALFASLSQKQVDALVVIPDPMFAQLRDQVTALAARHAVPAIYWNSVFPEAGGLMSYGSNIAEGYRQVGMYVGRILKGENPGDLPVQQPTKFELVVNLKTANLLGLTFPETLLATADKVIE